MDFSIIKIDEIQAKNPLTVDYALKYLEFNHTKKEIKACAPFTFVLGTDLSLELKLLNNGSLFWGTVILDINPNLTTSLSDGTIVLKVGTMLGANTLQNSVEKRITRYIEKENMLNESSSRFEFFDSLELLTTSTAYDVYVTFIGFKIDL